MDRRKILLGFDFFPFLFLFFLVLDELENGERIFFFIMLKLVPFFLLLTRIYSKERSFQKFPIS